MDEEAAPAGRPDGGRPAADHPRRDLRADRGGSGPHFSEPGLRMAEPGLRMAEPGLRMAEPGLRMAEPGRRISEPRLRTSEPRRREPDDEPPSALHRRAAVVAVGASAAALIGGGAYAVSQFFRSRPRTVKPEVGASGDSVAPAYTNENESYMSGRAGLAVRKNTPTTGTQLQTPAQAASAAVVRGNTALPKQDPVRHLAGRLTFGATPKLIADIRSQGIDGWIARQLRPETIAPTRGEQKLAAELTAYGMSYDQLIARKGGQADDENVKHAIGRMIWSDRQLFEMMVDLFNDFLHVPAYKEGNELFRAAFDRDVIRRHALGNYADMFIAANRHPALLNFLDQPQSTKNAINENLARENLERYSVGAGNGYNEADVHQAALLQTGRGIRNGQYWYRPEQHFVGPVKIMGFSHPNGTADDGEAAQDTYFRYLALHPNTARHLAQAIATRFVSDTPPKSVVDAMASAYLNARGAIVPVLMTMLSRTEFWESVGQKVRRPMEYLVATYRALEVQPDAPVGYLQNDPLQSPFSRGLGELQRKLDELGQMPMGRPTPNGYADVYVAWTSVDTMIDNWNEAGDAIQGTRRMFTYTRPERLLGPNPPTTAGAYVDALARRLVNATFTTTQRNAILSIAGPLMKAGTPVDATFNGAIGAIVRAILATPHHHLR